MKKKLVVMLATAITSVLLLAGCGGSKAPAEVPDLTGSWKSEANDGSWMAATINSDTIEVNWVSDNGSTTSLYWAGSYAAPTEAVVEYTWDSENDHEKTDSALMASPDDTKTFTYKNEKISYSVSLMGTTKTIELSRE